MYDLYYKFETQDGVVVLLLHCFWHWKFGSFSFYCMDFYLLDLYNDIVARQTDVPSKTGKREIHVVKLWI